MRRTPSAERTIRSTAGWVKVLWPESDAVEFAEDEVAHVVGVEPFGDDRVGDAALDVLVDAEVEGGEQAGPADEDEVVVFGEVLEEQPQLAEVGQVHEVGVVEDGGQGLCRRG